MSLQGIRNVPPNGVFGNEVYGSDSEGFGMNPSSNEFSLCNSDEWRSGNHGGRVIIHGYSGGGDMVVRHGIKGTDYLCIRERPCHAESSHLKTYTSSSTQIQKKFPHLFSEPVPSSGVAT
ncbi:hypothetical protein Tco_0580742 [Tanacetum coccineum]